MVGCFIFLKFIGKNLLGNKLFYLGEILLLFLFFFDFFIEGIIFLCIEEDWVYFMRFYLG